MAGILTAFVIMLPVILINGAYTGSAVEISSTLGVLGEDIRMAYYATASRDRGLLSAGTGRAEGRHDQKPYC